MEIDLIFVPHALFWRRNETQLKSREPLREKESLAIFFRAGVFGSAAPP